MNDIFKKLRELKYNQIGDCNYKIESDSDTVSVYFQESVGWDWVYNFLALPWYTGRLWVHLGLWIVYKKARKSILEEFKQEFREYKKVNVYGYSHGGGLAHIFAEDIYSKFGVKSDVILFGSMRPLTSKKSLEKVQNSTKSFISYRNGTDIVTVLPPWGKAFPVTQVGEKFNWFKIFKAGQYHNGYDKVTYKKRND